MKTKQSVNVNPEQETQRRLSLNRRRFLRGLGACLALPAFESIRPLQLLGTPAASLTGRAAATAAPVRMAFLQVPNGIIPASWWPEGDAGKDFALPPTLQPMEKIRHEMQVIKGLDDLSANAGPDGGGDHARAGGTFLTGVRIKKTSGADIYGGISIDQVVAQKIGHLTRFPSLELTTDAVRKAGDCDSGYSCAYEYNMSWRSPTQPVTPEPNPRLAFERLFGEGPPAQRAANLKRRQAQQHSILDFVMEDTKSLGNQMSGRDRAKLDQYLTSVREIEQRIERAEKMPVANPDMDTPAGIPPNFGDHIQLMFDILHLAFQSDSTRIATLLLAGEGSNRTFTEVGIAEGHHNLSHHRNAPETIAKVAKIDLWYTGQLAKFLEKMEATKDVDGHSLLHNSMILYGSGNADGNRHTHFDLPIMVAGSAGGRIKTGRYVKVDALPLTNLFLTMSDAMGAPGIERHGDSTGRLSVIS
jgi:hypothetical protein